VRQVASIRGEPVTWINDVEVLHLQHFQVFKLPEFFHYLFIHIT